MPAGSGVGVPGIVFSHVALKTHLQDRHTEDRYVSWISCLAQGSVTAQLPLLSVDREGVQITLGLASNTVHHFSN